jgi:CDP-glucose 4,6-dehydratase
MEGMARMIIEHQVPYTSFWQDRRVFVTGATGFIGSWIVKDLLSQGADIVVLVQDADPKSELIRSRDIQQVTVVDGELEDFWSLERAINKHEIETVLHLGAQTIVGTAHRFPLPTFEVNIRGTYNLLEACRLHRDLVKRVVIASSDKAYGEQTVLPYTEDMPLNGRHPYEVSKSCADLIAQSYWRTYALPVGIARCGNVYGGGDLNWSRIVPGTIRSLLNGKQPLIRSNGTYVRDYIYVKDISQAYMHLAECLDSNDVRGKAFNFSQESPLTVLSLVQTIRTMMGCGHIEPKILDHAEGEIHSQQLSASRARTILSWQPQYDLEQGLSETIEWYRLFFGRNPLTAD